MAQQITVNLAFTADTAQAKAQLQDLQKQLTELASGSSVSSGQNILTKEIQEASAAAAQLKTQLAQATLPSGKLDLTKFNTSLKQSGTSLESYRKTLEACGTSGQKAFASLATSIQNAEVPLRQTSTLMSDLKVTLMNAAKWQLSSSIIHGLMSGISTAVNYAEDLNESLNNIRIVTGQTSDQMAVFAENANKAAKALSTTTTDYTNASLIYYQQGKLKSSLVGIN